MGVYPAKPHVRVSDQILRLSRVGHVLRDQPIARRVEDDPGRGSEPVPQSLRQFMLTKREYAACVSRHLSAAGSCSFNTVSVLCGEGRRRSRYAVEQHYVYAESPCLPVQLRA